MSDLRLTIDNQNHQTYEVHKDYSRTIQINPGYSEAYGNQELTSNAVGNKPQSQQGLQTAAQLSQQQNNPELSQQIIKLLQSL